jgi:hypothetical protein
MSAARASRMPLRSLSFFAGSKRSRALGCVWTDFKMAFKCRFMSREPATRSATFCSSVTFQLTNSSMSGWSRSSTTILAARRVVPPDLIAPAARSPIFRKLMSPDDLPPPESGSPSPLSAEKFVPVPEPYLKMRASRTHRSMIPPSLTRSSLMAWMKQACGAGRS